MTTNPTSARPGAPEIASWIMTGVALVAVLLLHMLPAFLAGLFVYEMVRVLAPRLRIGRIRRRQGKLVAVAILVTGIVGIVGVAAWSIVAFVRSETSSMPVLVQQLADALDALRTKLPAAVTAQLPTDVHDLKDTVVTWMGEHAGTIQHVGQEAGRVLVDVLVGIVIGALVSLHEVSPHDQLGPLASALEARASRVGDAFQRVVFGQVRISAINAALTGMYLVVALPIFGVHVPLAKTMVAVTLVVGMLPVIGNLISNTIIVALSLSVSVSVGVVSLIFLVVIHKLEYFLNAHIVGAQVRAHAWELLIAMLVMEAAFGLSGLIAAPIYYAYAKRELVDRGLI